MCQFSKNVNPSRARPHNPQVQAQIQKSALTLLFGLSNAFQNGMRWPGSTHDQGNGLNASKVLPGGDWALVLPTHKLVMASLLSPKNFIQTGLSIPKLFMIFPIMDRQTHKSIWLSRQITPIQYTGMCGKCYTLFFYLFTHGVSLLCSLTYSRKMNNMHHKNHLKLHMWFFLTK